MSLEILHHLERSVWYLLATEISKGGLERPLLPLVALLEAEHGSVRACVWEHSLGWIVGFVGVLPTNAARGR